MFKWRWNPKKFCWYNKNTVENKALAESLNKSTDEMKDKKIPESKAFVDSLFNISKENKALKVTAQTDKKSKKV